MRILGFDEAVVASFDFLESYGLNLVERNSTFVSFESKKVVVNI
jgi:hypothetical protein